MNLVFKICNWLDFKRQEYKQYRIKHRLNPTFHFNGKDIKFYGEGDIVIGNNSYIGDYLAIQTVKVQ